MDTQCATCRKGLHGWSPNSGNGVHTVGLQLRRLFVCLTSLPLRLSSIPKHLAVACKAEQHGQTTRHLGALLTSLSIAFLLCQCLLSFKRGSIKGLLIQSCQKLLACQVCCHVLLCMRSSHQIFAQLFHKRILIILGCISRSD